MAPPVSFFSLQYVDYTKEISSFSIGVNTLNAANLVTQQTAHIALRDAINAITLGTLVQSETTVDRHRTASPGTAASEAEAQREKKWLVRYYDGTDFTQYTVEIPCADLSFLETHSDSIDMLDAGIATEWTDLKTAFEAVVRSPNGNAVVVTEVVYVGRNN